MAAAFFGMPQYPSVVEATMATACFGSYIRTSGCTSVQPKGPHHLLFRNTIHVNVVLAEKGLPETEEGAFGGSDGSLPCHWGVFGATTVIFAGKSYKFLYVRNETAAKPLGCGGVCGGEAT